MNWQRLAAIRTILLVLVGFAGIAVGAGMVYLPAGIILGGLLTVGLAYLTDSTGVRT